jgi:hypothetical protein
VAGAGNRARASCTNPFDLKKPIGVAGWETKLVDKLPKALAGSLPTVAEIEAELSRRPRGQKRRRRREASWWVAENDSSS